MAKVNAAGIIVENQKGEILVLHRKNFVPEGGRWGLPGGGVGEGLEPIEAALLKTRQEVKLEFNKEELRHLGEFKFVDGVGKRATYNAWIARLKSEGDIKINLNLEGHNAYKWEKPERLIKEQDLMVGMYPILEKYLQVKE